MLVSTRSNPAFLMRLKFRDWDDNYRRELFRQAVSSFEFVAVHFSVVQLRVRERRKIVHLA